MALPTTRGLEGSHPRLHTRAWLVGLIAVVGFAWKGIFARYAYAEGMGVALLLGVRFVFSTPLFWLVDWGQRGKGSLESPVRHAHWFTARQHGSHTRAHRRAFGHGILFFVAALCDFAAIEQIGAALACIILNATPAVVVLVDAWKTRRAPSSQKIVAFFVAWIGVVMSVAPSQSALPTAGLLCSFAAMASYAAYLYGSQSVTQEIGAIRYASIANTGTLLAALLVLPWLLSGDGFTLSTTAWVSAGLIIVCSTVLPFIALFEAIRVLGVETVSFLRLLGPPITVFLSYLLHDEPFTVMQGFGTFLVLAGVGLLKYRR